jgi:F-type H+-transporting ATPase subunit delta
MSAFASAYARALADVVVSEKLDTKQIDGQLADFLATLEGSRELQEILGNPSIALDVKLKVLDAIAPKVGLAKQVRNLVAVVLQNGRLHALGQIAAEYCKEINLRLHIREATITSARALDPEEKAEIEARASKLAGTQVQATFKRDASLLGGVVLRIGDTIYDGSVRGKLEELHAKLLAN